VLEAEWRSGLGMFSEGWRISVVGTHVGRAVEDWRFAVEIKSRSMAASSTAATPFLEHLCQ